MAGRGLLWHWAWSNWRQQALQETVTSAWWPMLVARVAIGIGNSELVGGGHSVRTAAVGGGAGSSMALGVDRLLKIGQTRS